VNVKLILKIAAVVVILIVAVQFSLAYVNQVQLKHVLEEEGLEARQADIQTEDELLNAIEDRLSRSSVNLPEEIKYKFEGVGDEAEDLVIYADYTQVVELFVYQVELDMHIEAVAETPAF